MISMPQIMDVNGMRPRICDTPKNVLIGCEESGVGREEFCKRGHFAYSVDLKPARHPSIYHVRGDIVEWLESCEDQSIDIGIFHPDCTTVCVAGNRTYAPGGIASPKRVEQLDWIVALWILAKRKCKRVAFENPASVIFPVLRSLGADVQYVQPWQHGHMEQKKTGLALHNLPRLVETNNVYDEMIKLPKAKRERIFYMSPGKDRARDRSESYTGILAAMADQWGAIA